MFKFLEAVKEPAGLRGIFSIILVATILAFYELGMFYKIVVPEIVEQVDHGINDLADGIKSKSVTVVNDTILKQVNNGLIPQSINDNISGLITNNKLLSKTDLLKHTMNPITTNVSNIFETFKERENILVNKINSYTQLTGLSLMIFLGLIMYLIYYLLKLKNEKIGKTTILISLITVGILIVFQYIFYLFGKKYSYIGSEGKEELIAYLFNQLKL